MKGRVDKVWEDVKELLKDIQPENTWCQIYNYNVGHSTLYIKLSNNQSIFYLIFSGVKYIEGPTAWNGAAFTKKSKPECVEFVRQRIAIRDISDEAINEILDLYTIDNIGFKVLCSYVTKSLEPLS